MKVNHIRPGDPNYPPPDIIEAVLKIERWASASRQGEGWRIGALADRRHLDSVERTNEWLETRLKAAQRDIKELAPRAAFVLDMAKLRSMDLSELMPVDKEVQHG